MTFFLETRNCCHFLLHVDHGGCVANNRLTIFDRYDKVPANGATFILYVFEVQMGHSVAKIQRWMISYCVFCKPATAWVIGLVGKMKRALNFWCYESTPRGEKAGIITLYWKWSPRQKLIHCNGLDWIVIAHKFQL